jgi:predicted DNA-binding protein with PD1-like motif
VHKTVVGSIGRVVVAQFERDEDLLEGIRHVIKTEGLRTGYIPTITGVVKNSRLQRFPAEPTKKQPTVTVELDGPLEASGSGLFGVVEAPEQGDRPFTLSNNVHGEPYVHVHLTVTSVNDTMSGHLMKGTLVNSYHPVSHFTVFFVETVGVELQIRCDDSPERLGYHVLTQTSANGS